MRMLKKYENLAIKQPGEFKHLQFLQSLCILHLFAPPCLAMPHLPLMKILSQTILNF